jgi:hypothetical protein
MVFRAAPESSAVNTAENVRHNSTVTLRRRSCLSAPSYLRYLRRTFVVILASAGLQMTAMAQNVQLPSARVRRSAEMELLERKTELLRTFYPDTASLRKDFNLVLDRLLMAQFTEAGLVALRDAKQNEDAARVRDRLDDVTPGEENDISLPLLRRIVTLLPKDRPLYGPPKTSPPTFLAASSGNRQPALNAFIGGDTSRMTADSVREVREMETHTILEDFRHIERNDPTRLAQLDTLERVSRAVVIRRKISSRALAPVHSREQALAFWRQPAFSTLNIGAISGNGDKGAAFTEIASPFLHFLRVSFNTVLSVEKKENAAPTGATPGTTQSTQASTTKASEPPSVAAINRFVNGGGLFNVAFAWPAAHVGLENGVADGILLIVPRFGATLPALGASQRDSTLLWDGGVEMHLKSVDFIDQVGVFLQTRAAYAGGSGSFAKLLGVTDRSTFGYATFSAGISLGGKYLISAGRTVSGPSSLRSLGWQVGVTALRSAAQP